MKKIFTYIAAMGVAATAVLSCQTVAEDNSHTDVVVPAPAVTITVSSVSDNSATITIAPDGEAAYFSYVVDASSEAEELDPATLYANKYSSVANGISKYVKGETESIEVKLSDLEANVTYQVYAVAGSSTGVVGEIAVKSFITSDTGLPEIDDYARQGNIYQILFTENITYNSSTPVTAKYYAANAIIVDDSGALTYDGEQGDANVEVAVSGAVAQFTVTLDGENPLPNGAYYAINIPEGAFTDAIGNKLPAVPIVTGLTSNGTLGFGGVYGRVPAGTFDLVADEEKTLALPSETYFVFGIPDDVELYTFASTAAATMTIEGVSGNASYSTAYKLGLNNEWGYAGSLGGIVVFYPGISPDGGDYVSIDIAEGSLIDIYGNSNSALSVKYLYSYNYSIADITGTYTFDSVSYYGVADHTEGVVIAPCTGDDAEEYDVVVYNLLSNTGTYEDLATYEHFDPTVFYGTVDYDSGILELEYDAIGTAEDSAYGIPADNYIVAASIVDNAWANLTFSIPAAGSMTVINPVYIVIWGLGWWDHIDSATLTRTSAEYTEPVIPEIAQASVKAEIGAFGSLRSAR